MCIRDSNTDDQQITTFDFDPVIQQITLSLENGGSLSISLASLEERLILNGHDLNIIGSSGVPISLAPYLDNTDDQQLQSLTYENGILNIALENGGNLSVNVQDAEVDPVFGSSAAAGITTSDIANWNDDQVDDADNDPNNEKDNTLFTKIGGHQMLISGSNDNVNNGNDVVVEWYIDDQIPAFVFEGGAGTDDQVLSLVDGFLSLEDGGDPIDLTQVVAASESGCVQEVVTTQTFVSPIDLPDDPEKRRVYINGYLCEERSTLTRIQHISINSTTNNVTFYEALTGDTVRFCRD